MKQQLYLSTAYLDDLMVRMAHHSTAIEGNSLTQGETKSVLIDGYVPRAIDLRELNEVLNYKSFTKEMVKFLLADRRVDGEFIKEIHAILCREAIESVPGKFKTQPNMVIGADFTPSPPYRVPMDIEAWRQDLEYQLNNAENDKAKVEAICRQHFRFEHIHPFPDGNGRVGRALMVYSALQNNMPPIVIPVGEKKKYINFLNTEDLNGFVDFCLELQQKEIERIKIWADERDKVLMVYGE
ncbi:MAG: cell filamentation protein Fic [Phascolarctobacterium sp.]|nr:MAG: cell filamentation protein Fic [Phascolarctobacterium sp.]